MMSREMHSRPSELMHLEDTLEAWCVDEAIAFYAALLRQGRRLAQKKTGDNSSVIAQLMGTK